METVKLALLLPG
jgi:hypothetical protein